ncbi:MAG: hypothetical protein Q8R18_00520 [bacterium]|nr:hypothetical protein [bacterium]
MSYRLKYLNTKPFLQDLEESKVPWSFVDICMARTFYPNFKNISLDTSTLVLFGKGGKCKITNNFPWRQIKPEYLGNSELGEKSVIEILPDEYDSIDAKELQIVYLQDTMIKKFVIPASQYTKGGIYKEKELLDMGASRLGEKLKTKERRTHHIWQALFNNNPNSLEKFIKFVDSNKGEEDSMPIYLENAGKYMAVPWETGSLERHYCAIGNAGFDLKKSFLLDII